MKKLVPIALVAGLALTGCSSTPEPATSTPSVAVTKTEASKKPSEPKVDCLPVDDSMLDAIAEGNSGAKLTAGKGVATKDGELYVIAMKFDDGQGEMTGLWASGSLTAGESLIGSVDGFAKEFTHWPDAKGSPWQVSLADKVSLDAKKCLG